MSSFFCKLWIGGRRSIFINRRGFVICRSICCGIFIVLPAVFRRKGLGFIGIFRRLYIIEVVFILTSALVTVNSGKDVLMEKYETARNLNRGVVLYLATALLSILALSLLASFALGGISG